MDNIVKFTIVLSNIVRMIEENVHRDVITEYINEIKDEYDKEISDYEEWLENKINN